MPREIKAYRSHGSGRFKREQFAAIGRHSVFEPGVLVFHPENIHLGENVYIGHGAILKGYYKNTLEIGDNTWIGQQSFIHAGGGVKIGKNVGVGPGVKIFSSMHKDEGLDVPIQYGEILFAQVVIEDDCDLGIGSIIMPGVRVGRGAQIGAGAVVARDVPSGAVAYGVPARVRRFRNAGV
jgi:acetyltransferase-like isoleucine patch superfamily enzyme